MSGITRLANQGAALPTASRAHRPRWANGRPGPAIRPASHSTVLTTSTCPATTPQSDTAQCSGTISGPYTHGLSHPMSGASPMSARPAVSLNTRG